MDRFKTAAPVLIVCAVVLLAVLFSSVGRGDNELPPPSTTETESSEAQESGEFQVDETISKASPEEAYVQIDDMVFQLGYQELLSDAVEEIEASGRYTIEGYDADAKGHSAEITVSRDGTVLFTLRASSIKEYADDSSVSYAAALFANDSEKNMVLTGITITDAGKEYAWIFSGTRYDGSGLRKEEFLTRFGSYSSDEYVYPSLVQSETDSADVSEYVLSVEVNAPKQEVLPSRVLTQIRSLRTLQYTFVFDNRTQECTSITIQNTVDADEVMAYWDYRAEESARQTGTTSSSESSSAEDGEIADEPAEETTEGEDAAAEDEAAADSTDSGEETAEVSAQETPETEELSADGT
ncbi:MAG: hypothetical protein ACOX78_03580 [Lachnospiraceae bacterium]